MIAFALGVLLAHAQPATDPAPQPAVETTPGAVRGRMPPLPPSSPPIPPGAAIIRNSGSTNSAGYTLVIAPDGAATVGGYEGYTRKTVAGVQTRWLFARLGDAGPLDSLGLEHCIKSASFGTSTRITWQGTTSGDISCTADPTSRELTRTIEVIVKQLAIPTFARPRRLRPL